MLWPIVSVELLLLEREELCANLHNVPSDHTKTVVSPHHAMAAVRLIKTTAHLPNMSQVSRGVVAATLCYICQSPQAGYLLIAHTSL
jgi:hypothetical protein